jgi:hypothetical protein
MEFEWEINENVNVRSSDNITLDYFLKIMIHDGNITKNRCPMFYFD